MCSSGRLKQPLSWLEKVSRGQVELTHDELRAVQGSRVLEDMKATILDAASKSADPPVMVPEKLVNEDLGYRGDSDNPPQPWLADFAPDLNPQYRAKNWPTTLHDTDETPFNLRHGYMWGRLE